MKRSDFTATSQPFKVRTSSLRAVIDYSFDNNIRVKYSLEKYYVPENTGKALEQRPDGSQPSCVSHRGEEPS